MARIKPEVSRWSEGKSSVLELKNIKKEYVTGDETVHALKGIDLQFRGNEFVAVLGPSGCGKTTLLNIVGGLDHYSSGDLVINGTSTTQYQDKDWDAYRNHSVGFVFQSYNLIPHQSVLSNVELALTLSGVSLEERRARAAKALEEVGLGDQLHKKPNQMSGGQMQRVAIARALVNDPDIILADEPTGALDTHTSTQIMEILKNVAKDRLVIMVTHNPELAEQYATRIIYLLDGEVQGDSHPFDASESEITAARISYAGRIKKTSMSLLTAFALSLNNLMTKKGRTLLTAFAGSIGIIGIALILSLSSGAQNYINDTEESTLSNYPLSIQSTSVDSSTMMSTMMGMKGTGDKREGATSIESNNIISGMISSIANDANKNDMRDIKTWLETNPGDIDRLTNDIQYDYKTTLNIFNVDTKDGIHQVNPSTVMDSIGFSTGGEGTAQAEMMSSMGTGYDVWTQMLDNAELVSREYPVVAGHMPENYDEVVVVLDANGRISDYTLYALGLKDDAQLKEMMDGALRGEKVEAAQPEEYSYDDIMGLEFKMVPTPAFYEKNGGIWEDKSEDEDFMKRAVAQGTTVKVVGIVEAGDEASGSANTWGYVMYSSDLMEHLIGQVASAPIVADQRADEKTDIFTGVPFMTDDKDVVLTMQDISDYMAKLPPDQAASMQAYLMQMKAAGMSDDQIAATFQKQMRTRANNATLDGNLKKLGVADLEVPATISIYPLDFEAKAQIDTIITDHNKAMQDSGNEDKVVHYSDIVGTMMSSVTNIINAISYILIAFVAISLVVSSIMIGIITYISVLERTKEIGILRSIGASKKDISHVFNAETFLIGLASGVLGVLVTVLLNIPLNMVIESITGISGVASLPWAAAGILIAISTVLTLIGGLVPSKMAAKKDPVTALRSE
ncbi:MAG: ABC transporter ATP-binding protein/permease [Raoultibacter sp.]